MDELNIIYHGLWRHESFLSWHYWRICGPDLRTIEATSVIFDRCRHALIPEVPAVRNGRIVLIDGKMVSWYGPRIGHSLLT